MALETGGSSWHHTNRGVSMFIAVYMALFYLVIFLSKLLHDRPTIASYFPEAAMIIVVGMAVGLIFNIALQSGSFEADGGLAENLLSFSPTVFFVVLVR